MLGEFGEFGEFGEPLPELPALEPFACPHCGGELSFLRD
jgi:hypothetical protein